MANADIIVGNTYTCPICNKSFIATNEHHYFVFDGYTSYEPTCSWKCFRKGAHQACARKNKKLAEIEATKKRRKSSNKKS